MPITLKQTLSASSPADKYDTRQVKNALNRLGYYIPYEKAGITQYPDAPLFTAIKKFQKDNNIPVTGIIKPDDATLTALNKSLESTPDGYYIWHTVKDGKARSTHSALDGTMRKWGETPYPGSEFNCRCWGETLLPNSAEVRKKAILENGDADFIIKKNTKANPNAPIYAIGLYSEVERNKKIIENESAKAGIDADLVKAIIYIETTQGYYDRIAGKYNKSIRPMNIKFSYWKDLGISRKYLENPNNNIKIGIKLLRKIKSHMPNAGIAEIATVYNSLGAIYVSDYGARVEMLYKTKPWNKQCQK